MSTSTMNAKAAMAINAMKAIGIPEKIVKPVLKNLLKLYDKNWELIEDENYRVLADAIFEYQDNEAEEAKKNKEEQLHDETTEPPLKRLRLRHQGDQVSQAETSHKRTKLEEATQPEDFSQEETMEPLQKTRSGRAVDHEPTSPQVHLRDKQKEPISIQAVSRQGTTEPSALVIRERIPEPEYEASLTRSRDKGKELALSPQSVSRQAAIEQSHLHANNGVSESHSNSPKPTLRDKGKEPISPHMTHKEKVVAHKEKAVNVRANSVICLKEPKIEPGILLLPKAKSHNPQKNDTLIKPKDEPFTDNLPQFEVPIAIMPPTDRGNCTNGALSEPLHKQGCSTRNDSTVQTTNLEPSPPQNKDIDHSNKACENGTSLELASMPEHVEIASSPSGEVRLSLSCNYASEHPDFHVPSLEAVLKAVEDKCLRSYKILDPNFSMTKLMQEICQCFLDLSTDSSNTEQENFIRLTHNFDFLKKSNLQDVLCANGKLEGNFQMPAGLNGPDGPQKQSLVVAPQQIFPTDTVRQIHDVNDIAKGEERVRISLINEGSGDSYPPRFCYIPRNIVYQNAYVNFSLARIVDEDCCTECFGDCLSSAIPCACARETGGEFAYTLEGVVKESFLDECISMNRNPEKHKHYYCKECPLEKSNKGKCEGHLVRKFIKECWSKCGCNKQCGNRVVQRGISCNLQVFFTSEGKGWGLRTLEDLPKGTFVCEYVGEILTNTELHERNTRSSGKEKHTYPVLLDADWGSEGVLKDEEALCLDATFYGNVARFINHRCFDANLVEIPVEVETPDHHYYHLAFFTTRNVDALEELTWDYGIDFDDRKHPVKAFRCHCGSEFCKDMKRPRRSKSRALILR